MEAPGRLLAGEIGKPHGLMGEVYVVPISDDPRRFKRGATLIHEDGRELVVETARTHGNRFLVKFQAVNERDEAESLRGAVYVPADDARELDQDEYWPHELQGCAAVLKSGEPVGDIVRVVPGAAQDLLALETARGERLVPVVKEIVVEVDINRRRVVIDPPPGLLD